MKSRLSILISLLLCFTATPASGTGQATDTRRIKHSVSVNGVRLGDSYGRVVRQMGKPRKRTKQHNEVTLVSGTDWSYTLDYPGAVVELAARRRNGPFDVVRISVTGARWRLNNGVRLGMSPEDVIAKLGAANYSTPGDTDDQHALVYVNHDGHDTATFEFVNRRLVHLEWRYDFS